MANAALVKASLYVVVDDLRETTELLSYGLRLPDKDLENAIFDALRQDEVVAVDLAVHLDGSRNI